MLDFLLGNDFLSSIIAFALVLIPAVVIHEFGHFLAGKSAGITILEFGIGYPPRAFKLFRWRETDFTLNWIPFGGFVRPFGEDMIRPLSEEEMRQQRTAITQTDGERETAPTPPAYSERDELARRGVADPKGVNDVTPFPRFIFFVAGSVANIIGAFVLFVIIGLIGIEQLAGARTFIVDLPQDSPLAMAGIQQSDFIERVNGEYFDNSRDLYRRIASAPGQEVVLTVRRFDMENPRLSNVLEIPVMLDADQVNSLVNARGQLVVSFTQEGSPADLAGILPDDIIVGMGGESLSGDSPFDALLLLNRRHEGVEVLIGILRDGEYLELPITPRINPEPSQGHLGASIISREFADLISGVIYGDAPAQFDFVPLAIGDALVYGVEEIGGILRLVAELPSRLLSGDAQPEEGRIVSIVGITQLGSEFLQQSIQENQPITILRFIALVSIALGITNLLPIPPLDGGRILFVLIEAVRGRPMSARREEFFLMVGVVFLLSLGVVVIINDILYPITDLLN